MIIITRNYHTPGVILVTPLPVVLVEQGCVVSWGALLFLHVTHGTGVIQHHHCRGMNPLQSTYTPMQGLFISTNRVKRARLEEKLTLPRTLPADPVKNFFLT